jgi:hypothetical protein
MAWLILLLGLVVLVACFTLPREIGKEDEPLTSTRLEVPDVEQLILRMRQRRQPPRPRPAAAPRVMPQPAPVEPPPAMGAPQPVLTDTSPEGPLDAA